MSDYRAIPLNKENLNRPENPKNPAGQLPVYAKNIDPEKLDKLNQGQHKIFEEA